MSINVTVSGNPVVIKRGKMVTSCDPEKTEFEKRRLMRLEQVRQQSKDIAQTVRNKLKKEKAKCLSEIEKEGEIKLKNWQTRKLLELQNQYQDALDEIGIGHKEAEKAEDEAELILEQQDNNDRIAKERGRVAAERLQISKNEESLRKAMPIQRKKITRDEENSRSSNITRKNSKQFKKKKKRSEQQLFDSDGENRVPQLFNLGEMDSFSSASLEATNLKESPKKLSKEQQTSQSQFLVPKSDKAAQTLTQDEILVSDNRNTPFDTRISEYIKRRTRLNQHSDYCDYAYKDLPPYQPPQTTNNKTRCCCQCPERHHEQQTTIKIPETTTKKSSEPLQEEPKKNQEPEPEFTQRDPEYPFPYQQSIEEQSKTNRNKSKSKKNSTTEIPMKPKITLRSSKDRIDHINIPPPPSVQYYDHPNRFSKQFIPPKSSGIVEKIQDDHLDISPNLVQEEDMKEKMRQRDVEAQVRGQVALEKERIQREYRELLKKLPVLQKQERIYEIGTDKEKYHMSRNRLEEMEKKRQNRLDNAYEEVFVRGKSPTMVTLPTRRRREYDEEHTINWDVDYQPSNNSRAEQLNDLLMNLKAHKDSLIKEIEQTLSKEDDLTILKPKRKRSREDRPPSPTSSDHLVVTGEESSKSSPRKKPKLKSKKKRVLVLQNSSTQTTPTPKTEQSVATSPLTTTEPTTTATTISTTTDKCVCPKGLIDDLCEIVIRIKEDEKPEVTVNPPVLGKNVKVVTSEERKIPIEEEGKKDENGARRGSKKTTTKTTISSYWKDSLSSSQGTSSTSYLEPPKSSGRLSTTRKTPEFEEIWKNSTIISSDGSKILDPRLLTYIKKLLKMSRASIDDLAVSASDVSTPSESVVETPANNPLTQLKNVMKYFNLDFAELQKQLSFHHYSDEKNTTLHYNTSDSVTITTTNSSGHSGVEFKSCTEVDAIKEKKSIEDTKKLMEYADIAASCTKKISNLTAMIEKVREEKKKMLESPPTSSSSSDKDMTTTSYLNLPDKEEKNSSSMEEVDNKLLTIDYSYAEKLKHLTDEEIRKEKIRIETKDKDLLAKLEIFRRQDDNSNKNTEKEESPPLFLDIPKLPRLEAPSLDNDQNKKKRPPPSKGLRILPGPVTMVPHELSTIVEADSQLSTKLDSPKKTTSTSESSSSVPDILTEVKTNVNKDSSPTTTTSEDVSEMETMETMLISIGMEWAIPTLKKTREALALSSSSGGGSKSSGEVSLREFLSKISSSSNSNDSQGMSLIQVDNRRTSTPILEQLKEGQPVFLTDSDLSSVREQSNEASKTG